MDVAAEQPVAERHSREGSIRANAQRIEELAPAANVLTEIIGDLLVGARETAAASDEELRVAETARMQLADQLQGSEQRLGEITRSRSYRASRLLSKSLRAWRRGSSASQRLAFTQFRGDLADRLGLRPRAERPPASVIAPELGDPPQQHSHADDAGQPT